jgi:N-methylhydantoinase A/oxoprolinase/acetone carboxylase beta subunit
VLVDDPDTTTVVPPGWTVSVDAEGNLRLERAT